MSSFSFDSGFLNSKKAHAENITKYKNAQNQQGLFSIGDILAFYTDRVLLDTSLTTPDNRFRQAEDANLRTHLNLGCARDRSPQNEENVKRAKEKLAEFLPWLKPIADEIETIVKKTAPFSEAREQQITRLIQDTEGRFGSYLSIPKTLPSPRQYPRAKTQPGW